MKKVNLDIINSDVLIIGSGIAGLKAALEVLKKGKRPLLVSKSPMGKANNTYLAGGGFNFATGSFDIDSHFEKTLQAGKKLNDRSLVQAFVKEAPSMIKELQEMGMKGTLHGMGLSTWRNALIGGPEVTNTLLKACQKAGLQSMEGIMVTDLITKGQACYGAIGFERRTGKFYGFQSRAVLLATGGAGAIYAQNDNAPGITGDGYVLGLEAGLELIDMEFVQFYPICFAGSGPVRLIVPPIFGDLGKITNRLGEDLKEKYDLHERPLAVVARDRFARALFQEIKEGNGIDGALLLDMEKVEDARIPLKDSFKELFKKRTAYDSKPIKIAPACHHTMGGLTIDGSCHTRIKGLFAAGEVVGGIHGANRMGGNALSESLVFGALAARTAVEYANFNPALPGFEAMGKETAQRRYSLIDQGSSKLDILRSLMRTLRQVIWEKAGIIRDESSLKESVETIDGCLGELEGLRAGNPQELWRIMECRNAALTGRAIAVSALKRTESRGSHYRDDFPAESEDWIKHIYVRMMDGLPNVDRIMPIAE
jgi:succinate dehydrogenase/fumarate reductase flavoprotein subunit